ncbi:MAG: putative hydrogenase nickel incorporation protein HypA [Candidatus Methanofastidiosum methylothiophilum]|uniref:Hydrogenase maturation factor HypA n=1 Tax=Candidatus Methanofastidiosum methylothiophilum TaxID=1705564 RepID=A0A150IZZ4_9EURY|nr:MAG: putative hydrogenase nickel incorporation protein HypA [Candidatus Methanofastidiosum methylthiophilus]KYC47949.1 MAG: putative hydrogenase nickel incorporation protein HypA [Candidatus Methanofastidiosum methylthiophilus]KYC50567.1 MAG: putative hydrogenase nickel incorporation protein HypA [Candidatus Methanofastidiosum methylthiophilus]
MHELSLADGMLKTVLEAAKKENAKKIKSIKLEMGEILLVNTEQLTFCFDVISKGTIAEGAKLEITFLKPRAICNKCGKEFNINSENDFPLLHISCDCGSNDVKILSGREFNIKSIKIEEN